MRVDSLTPTMNSMVRGMSCLTTIRGDFSILKMLRENE